MKKHGSSSQNHGVYVNGYKLHVRFTHCFRDLIGASIITCSKKSQMIPIDQITYIYSYNWMIPNQFKFKSFIQITQIKSLGVIHKIQIPLRWFQVISEITWKWLWPPSWITRKGGSDFTMLWLTILGLPHRYMNMYIYRHIIFM